MSRIGYCIVETLRGEPPVLGACRDKQLSGPCGGCAPAVWPPRISCLLVHLGASLGTPEMLTSQTTNVEHGSPLNDHRPSKDGPLSRVPLRARDLSSRFTTVRLLTGPRGGCSDRAWSSQRQRSTPLRCQGPRIPMGSVRAFAGLASTMFGMMPVHSTQPFWSAVRVTRVRCNSKTWNSPGRASAVEKCSLQTRNRNSTRTAAPCVGPRPDKPTRLACTSLVGHLAMASVLARDPWTVHRPAGKPRVGHFWTTARVAILPAPCIAGEAHRWPARSRPIGRRAHFHSCRGPRSTR